MQSDNELLVPEMQNKLGVTVFASDIKSVENYPNFDNSAWSTGVYTVNNIEGESS